MAHAFENIRCFYALRLYIQFPIPNCYGNNIQIIQAPAFKTHRKESENQNIRGKTNSLIPEGYACSLWVRGCVMIRSESEQALDLLNQMSIPYPERILDGARTKKS